MTTAAEAILSADCADLSRQLATANAALAELRACKLRLNALIVARDREINTLQGTIARLEAELTEARTGIVAPPY
jgi:hypothetical protein